MTCEHPLCELIGGACSLATHRSRGCRPNLATRDVAPEVFEEVRAILVALEASEAPQERRAAAIRLAAIVRREALEDRNLIRIAKDDAPELAVALAHLCRRAAVPG
jgi:hypothetical protein